MTKLKTIETLQQPTSPPLKLSSLRSTYIPILCLLIGFVIGIYVTAMGLNDTSQCGGTLSVIRTGMNTTIASLTRNNIDSTIPNESSASLTRNNTNTTLPKESSDDWETSIADVDMVKYLHNTTRVLCWIMTNPDNHLKKAIHIRNTWGRRCNKLLFMSSQEDEVLETVALPVAEGREHLWNKTKFALKYIYDHHLDDAEWFLKADDDTYVIMENLRLFLYQYPPEAPIYFGCKFARFIWQGYMSGGAGYALSKNALIKFATEAYDDNKVCDNYYAAEDIQLGSCLENIGVIAGDSRDADGMERFVPLTPETVIPEYTMPWYPKFVYHTKNHNVSCCSPQAISFHYLTGKQMYVMEYLLYALRPFGVFAQLNESLPAQRNASDILSEALQYDFQPIPAPPSTEDDFYF